MSNDSAAHTKTATPVGAAEGAEAHRPDVFQELWSQALVAVGSAEEEVRRVMERFAEATDFHPEELQRMGRELVERLRSQRRDLETSLEDGIKRTLAGLRLPTTEDLEALKTRLQSLSERVARAERAGKPAAGKDRQKPSRGVKA